MAKSFSSFETQQASKPTLLDQHLFTVAEDQSGALLALLDCPVRGNTGLTDLFSRQAPWACSGPYVTPADS